MEARRQPKKKYLATQRLRRDLERSSAESLALDVNSLRQEIASLRTVREIVQAQRLAAAASASPSAAVAQFFATIRDGVSGEPGEQLRFLRSSLEEDVRFGPAARGRDMFLQQCVVYKRIHARLHVDPPALRELLPAAGEAPLPVVVATNHVRVRLSRRTFEVLFPHVLADEPLVQELIGCEVAYPCETRVYFNSARRIARYDAEVDFVTGLNDALRSLRKVTEIMDHARLDGCVILLDDHPDLLRIADEVVAAPEGASGGDGGEEGDGADDDCGSDEAASRTNSDGGACDQDEPRHLVADRMSINMLLS